MCANSPARGWGPSVLSLQAYCDFSAGTSLALGSTSHIDNDPVLLLQLFEAAKLGIVSIKVSLELGCALQEIGCSRVDLPLHIKLVTLDLEDGLCSGSVSTCASQDQSLHLHVLFNLLKSNVRVGDIVGRAEFGEALRLASQTGLHLEDVEESLPSDLTSVRSQQDVLASLSLHLIGESNGLREIELLEQSLSKLSEAVRVGSLLAQDQGQGDRLNRVVL